MGTHILESAEGGTSQDNKIKRASKGNSQTGEHRDESGTAKESCRAKVTHILKSAGGGASQWRRKEVIERRSLTNCSI
jgi:hypothetical protein